MLTKIRCICTRVFKNCPFKVCLPMLSLTKAQVNFPGSCLILNATYNDGLPEKSSV